MKQTSVRLLVYAILYSNLSFAEDPRLLSHLLGYIGLDYSAAVERPGVVVNAGEYAEMVEFIDSAFKEAGLIPEVRQDAFVNAGLSDLKSLILQKAAPATVASLAKRLEDRVASVCKLGRVPFQWPDLAHGEKMFGESCAQCHGVTGQGDGLLGRALDPRPANFLDNDRMAKMTPFNIFNAIRLGVPGTGMAAFLLSDDETWNLAFFVQSLRHRGDSLEAVAGLGKPNHPGSSGGPMLSLAKLAERSDDDLLKDLTGSSDERRETLRHARIHQIDGSNQPNQNGGPAARTKLSQFVDIALARLVDAERAYEEKNWDRSEKFALAAYLDGVELFEARLRSRDSDFVVDLEKKMAAVRMAIARRSDRPVFLAATQSARSALESARTLLEGPDSSPLVMGVLSAGIVMREALEAILILIALLGVVRSANVKIAALSVHLGWVSALAAGGALWVFSGWVFRLSGLQRELLEGFVTVFAVAVLLYFGFWLHRKTEVSRWRSFLSQVAAQLADGRKLFGLFGVAFMAVFREAFETVLFLRALSLESSGVGEYWIGLGVLAALVFSIVLAAVTLRASAKIPIRELFLISSTMLVVLAVTLIGKAIHAFQEAGYVGITTFPLELRSDLLGVYPSWETLIPQVLIVALAAAVWSLDRSRAVSRSQLPQS